MRSARAGLEALHAALSAEGGPVAAALVAPGGALDEPGPAQVAASGPRASESPEEYELLLEMILEGARLHYGQPRLVQPREPNLRLLLGDQLYALGLERLAALGDLVAVRELADVISLVAQAHAEGDAGRAEAVWHAAALAIGWGGDEAHEAAKALARRGEPDAEERLRDVVAGAPGAR